MEDAVICSPVRTPIGRYGGSLREFEAQELAAIVVRELVERAGLDEVEVEEVVLGQCYPSAEAPAIGRVAALKAGLPITTAGSQVDRRCGSGLEALCNAAMKVQTGVAEVVIAGGVESMSTVEHYFKGLRWSGLRGDQRLIDRLQRSRVTAGSDAYPVPGGMLETAENLRRIYGITREAQDEWSLISHERAVHAQQQGYFDAEIVPIRAPDPRHGQPQMALEVDEHPRPGTTLEKLASLKPVMAKQDPESTVTAGNSSGQNDAAAVCLVTTRSMAENLGLKPLGVLRGWALGGVEPHLMGLGPVPAIGKLLSRAGLNLEDIDVIEINEAFAAQFLAVAKELEMSDELLERVNVNGSGISLGHPVGATGARIMSTLLHEMERRHARFGLESMCIGGGQGMAALIERID